MESSLSPVEETRLLADAMFDGRIDRVGTERLEELIVKDVSCLQVYVSRLTFHGEILKDAREDSPTQSAVGAIQEFTQAVHARERRRWLAYVGIYIAMAASVMLILGGMVFSYGVFQAPALGHVANLTSSLRSNLKQVDLGQVIRKGDIVTVEEGVLSLQLPHAMVDLLGPASIRFEGNQNLRLKSGTLLAKISPGGEGFTVRTPDAEVIDLGTEFLVRYDVEEGTEVSVRQGRAQASLLDWLGKRVRVQEITDRRTVRFSKARQVAREVEYQAETFSPIDRSRGGILRIDGALRTETRPYVALFSGQVLTPKYMIVIPEKQNFPLPEDLEVRSSDGPVRLAAGTIVSSYLLHYDPTESVTTAPRGAVTFHDEIAGIIVDLEGLQKTDSLLGLPGVTYETADYRAFDLEEDEAHVSKDRKTASFYCGINPSEHLDEARVIVVSSRAVTSAE